MAISTQVEMIKHKTSSSSSRSIKKIFRNGEFNLSKMNNKPNKERIILLIINNNTTNIFSIINITLSISIVVINRYLETRHHLTSPTNNISCQQFAAIRYSCWYLSLSRWRLLMDSRQRDHQDALLWQQR